MAEMRVPVSLLSLAGGIGFVQTIIVILRGVVSQDHCACTKFPFQSRSRAAKVYMVSHGFKEFAWDIHGINEAHGNAPWKVAIGVVRISNVRLRNCMETMGKKIA